MVDPSRLNLVDAAHLKAIAARAMRQVLVDHARARDAQKGGGNAERITLTEADLADTSVSDTAIDVLDLERAMQNLASLDERKAQVVELRFFGGMSIEETAEVLNVARATVTSDWTVARAWLAAELQTEDDG